MKEEQLAKRTKIGNEEFMIALRNLAEGIGVGISGKDASYIWKGVLDFMKDRLEKGKTINLSGLASMRLKPVTQQTYIDMRTKEALPVKNKLRLKCAMSQVWKLEVNKDKVGHDHDGCDTKEILKEGFSEFVKQEGK